MNRSYAKEPSTTSSYGGSTCSRTRRSGGQTFSEEDQGRKISIPNHFEDAIKSPQRKQWSDGIRRDMVRVKERDACELGPINRVPNGQKVIGSRFVFKQKAGGRFKAPAMVRGHSQEAAIDYEKKSRWCVASEARKSYFERLCCWKKRVLGEMSRDNFGARNDAGRYRDNSCAC